jgi:exodeoxyribonuclease VII small subunit
LSEQSEQHSESGSETNGPSFEQAMAELEALVERLESGEQGLEQDLADFERGIALARQCEGQLKDAEQVVYRLVGEPGEERLDPFDEPPSADDG